MGSPPWHPFQTFDRRQALRHFCVCSRPSPWRSRWWRSSPPASHAALTDEFRASFDGARQIERVNALIYAAMIGIARADPCAGSRRRARSVAARLIVNNDRLGDVVTELQWEVKPQEQAAFEAFAQRIKEFQEFRRDLVRRGIGADPAGRAAKRRRTRPPRAALNRDIEQMGADSMPSARSSFMPRWSAASRESAWLLAALAVFAAAARRHRRDRGVARLHSPARASSPRSPSRSPTVSSMSRCPIAAAATRSARWPARSRFSRRRCAATKS